MLRNYLKTALRVLLRRKFYTFISLFAISFTLLVVTLATAMLDSIFAPYPPEVHADRSLLVMSLRMSGPKASQEGGPGYGFLDRCVRGLASAERVSIFSDPDEAVSFLDGRKVKSFLRRTDGEYWKILEFDFVEGEPFTAADDREGNPVAVINEATRDRFFGANAGPAAGKSLEVAGRSFRVVGVVRNVPITRIVPFGDIWVPIGSQPNDAYKSDWSSGYAAVVLAPSRKDLPRVQAEFQERLKTTQIPDPEYTTLTSGAETLFETVSRNLLSARLDESRPGLLRAIVILVLVLFMALPTLNLVNLNLSRILERAPEIGVRKAFGASSLTLVGQFVVENVFLTLVGGALGWILSALVLAAVEASDLIPYAHFQLNLRILAWGVLTALFFGVLSGVYPAWRMSRLHPVAALRGASE